MNPSRHAILAPLFAVMALLIGLAGNASAAFNPAAQNPHYGNYLLQDSEASADWMVEIADPTRGNGAWVYDSALGVPVYVRQNPWSAFDPLGLEQYAIEKVPAIPLMRYLYPNQIRLVNPAAPDGTRPCVVCHGMGSDGRRYGPANSHFGTEALTGLTPEQARDQIRLAKKATDIAATAVVIVILKQLAALEQQEANPEGESQRDTNEQTQQESGGKVRSVYSDGTKVEEGKQPQRISGPDPKAQGGHSVLRTDEENNRVYQQREYDEEGYPVRDVDRTNPTFPNGKPRPEHPGPPHQHKWKVNDPKVGPKSGHKRVKSEPID